MLALHRIKVTALEALKGNVATFRLEAGVVAAIIVDPQTKEDRGDEEAVDDRGGDEVHAGRAKDEW
jgi:hypothetical protein